MDLYAVMTEVDTRLRAIVGLHPEMGHAGKIAAIPAAIQYPPDMINYDETYRRGGDSMEDLLVVVFVGRASNRQALKDLAPYVAGSGAKSIKAKLDATDVAPYASCSDLTVTHVEFDWDATVAGASYAAALFHCKIAGAGA